MEGIRSHLTTIEELWATARFYGSPEQVIESLKRSISTHSQTSTEVQPTTAQIIEFPTPKAPPTE